MNPHPSLTHLNSRQVQTAPQFPAGPDWASIPGSPGFTCPPAPPATWVHMASCAPPPGVHMPSSAPPPGFTCPPAPRHLGSHALLPSSAPPPGFTCPPAPRHLGFTCPPASRHLGSHALLPSSAPPPGFTCPPARHLGFTCPPALLRPATWGSHALLRPATWVSHALLPSSAPPATRPSCTSYLNPPQPFTKPFCPNANSLA